MNGSLAEIVTGDEYAAVKLTGKPEGGFWNVRYRKKQKNKNCYGIKEGFLVYSSRTDDYEREFLFVS